LRDKFAVNNSQKTYQPLCIQPLRAYPLIKPGDDISQITLENLTANDIRLENDDILVFAQKIISKSENRLVNLSDVNPSKKAIELAEETDKDARLVELILSESNSIVRTRPGVIIAEHKNGFVCANAGIDHSNVEPTEREGDHWVLLLPVDADQSAQKIQESIFRETGKRIGVLITDSHGRAWRLGTVGISIGTALIPELVNRIGDVDMFGYTLRATVIAAADQLAAGAALMMGEADEGTPVVHVRGFPYSLSPSSLQEVIRPAEKDLFR
jgi:coenzyme F420-0:L-glutamate ligase/coenzyme F420-1:gamma-L-glutamate ligase